MLSYSARFPADETARTDRVEDVLKSLLRPSVLWLGWWRSVSEVRTISASISSFLCISALAYSRGSPGYASGSGSGREVEDGWEGGGSAMSDLETYVLQGRKIKRCR